MKKIKILISLLLISLIAFGVYACGGTDDAAESSTSESPQESAQTEASAEPSAEPSESAEPSAVEAEEVSAAPEETQTGNETEEDETIIDNDDYVVIFNGLKTGVEPDAVELKFYVENKTDNEISFQCDDISINDTMTRNTAYKNSSPEIPVGKKANIVVITYADNIDNIENIEFETLFLPKAEDGDYYEYEGAFKSNIILTFEDNKLDTAEVKGDEQSEASDSDDSSNDAVSEEEIDAALQGKWTNESFDGGYFEFKDGQSTLILSAGSTAPDKYTIDIENNVIEAQFKTADGQVGSLTVPYEYNDGELVLYNNNGEPLYKKD